MHREGVTEPCIRGLWSESIAAIVHDTCSCTVTTHRPELQGCERSNAARHASKFRCRVYHVRDVGRASVGLHLNDGIEGLHVSFVIDESPGPSRMPCSKVY